MIWLKKLLRDVDNFYKNAINSSSFYKQAEIDYEKAKQFKNMSPEDKKSFLGGLTPEEKKDFFKYMAEQDKIQKQQEEEALKRSQDNPLYRKMIDTINDGVATKAINTDDVDVDDFLQIAEEYKEACKLNAGYSTVWKNLNIFINNNEIVGEDEDEENPLEDVINEVRADLKTRAGGIKNLSIADSSDVQAKLKAARERAIEEIYQGETPTAFQQGQQGGQPTYNPLLEGGGENAPKSKSGYGVEDEKTYKDWVKTFDNEAAYYRDQLIGIDDPNVINNTNNLVTLLDKLKPLAKEREDLKQQIILTPDDKNIGITKEKFRLVNEKIKELNAQRARIKKKIRVYFINKNNENLKLQVNDSDLSMKDKLILMQRIGLNELLASNDYNKQEEKTLRQNLIAILEDKIIKVINGVPRRVSKPKNWVGGGLPSRADLQKMLEAIEIAKSKRIPITAKRKETADILRAKKSAGDLDGLARQLTENIGSVKMGIKKDKVVPELIKNKIKSEQHAEFQTDLDNIEAAVAAGDKTKVLMATKALQLKMMNFAKEKGWIKVFNKEAENHPIIMEYNNARIPYYDFRDKTVKLYKELTSEGIAAEIYNDIRALIFDGEKLISNGPAMFRSPHITIQKIVDLLKSF